MLESYLFLASLADLGAVLPKFPAHVSDCGQPQASDGYRNHPQEHRAAHKVATETTKTAETGGGKSFRRLRVLVRRGYCRCSATKAATCI